jgi:hypothetical protein
VDREGLAPATDVAGEDLVPKPGADRVVCFASGLVSGLTSGLELETGFEFRFSQLRIGMELAARLRAVLELD